MLRFALDSVSCVQFGIVAMPEDPRGVVEAVRDLEDAGFDAAGIPDTAPLFRGATYPLITASLLQTERIRVGPFCTNLVSQHWSVHACTARTLEALCPERYFLGLATGDGALHSVGLRPASIKFFEDNLAHLRQHFPTSAPIQVAASGLGVARVAGRLADSMILGLGLDVSSLIQQSQVARSARAAASVEAPLEVWGMVTAHPVLKPSDVESVRDDVRGLANAMARFTFARTFEHKNVPPAFEPIIAERLRHYDFAYHGKPGLEVPQN
jgi:alkanesulfonate monooxygenase SsuD/methylene tetrahydromethanopterin reductase-like flavin-dependent oxidoreductase (luciferase family)